MYFSNEVNLFNDTLCSLSSANSIGVFYYVKVHRRFSHTLIVLVMGIDPYLRTAK